MFAWVAQKRRKGREPPFFPFLGQYLAENKLTAGVALYYLKKKTREKGHKIIFNNFIEQKYTNKWH